LPHLRQLVSLASPIKLDRSLLPFVRSVIYERRTMRVQLLTILLAAAGVGLPALSGCDETIHKEEKVKVKDGSVEHDVKETKRQPDGTIVKEEKHEVEKRN
jgi:hypothetical protein